MYQQAKIPEGHEYQIHLYIDTANTLTTLKRRPHQNNDHAGPKGQLVLKLFFSDFL